ncbi:hypothetical protein L6452_39562 [Arctium lappa]|uniref:Uncharacterized protein n=1 Tax=Arctium lappa TaxID=4217 RepID=A0ACB8XWS2_ARCLA|nr:hypothetical protein L6452_39562 [Arctium lappa]
MASSSFNPTNSEDIFEHFFNLGRNAGSPPSSSRVNFNPRNADQFFSEFFDSNGSGSVSSRSSVARKAPAVEKSLACSLEDLYNGGKKKVKISRKVIDLARQVQTIEETITIEIKPGWKKGTKITFVEKGNFEPGFVTADLIFVIDEKPHGVFTREGNDLIINRKILLLEALAGKTIELTTLDGRILMIPVTEIVKPGYELIYPNEGMPVSKEPMKKGNLVIKFDVKYPTTLTAKQKYFLEKALGGNP